MSNIITVSQVSKRYSQNTRQVTLRHNARSLLRQWLGRQPPVVEINPFWALRDISFEITAGERVGILGRNGAGKSTLLRVISQITAPTTGFVQVNGRYASLLSLGVGFSGGLSGRKNIYMNAALHGWYPRQTNTIIDDIIAFSELGEAIEWPVQHYSSGMRARLGFSIAIHTLPDIIFLDEVFSVGDDAFREKCQQRILDLKSRNVTLLLVSHSLPSVRAMCDRCLLLDHGRLLEDGPVDQVIRAYQKLLAEKGQSSVIS